MQHQHHHGWVAMAPVPSLCVRDAARTTFRDVGMSPLDVSPGTDNNLQLGLGVGLAIYV